MEPSCYTKHKLRTEVALFWITLLARRSWFTMAPKRRSLETDEQIIKQGCLTKSPPSYIFNKRASWKGRLLKLCKTGLGTYFLRYYAYDGVSEDWRGEINMNDVKSIEVGSSTMDRIATITRLFNHSPNNVLCIKTDKRDYFLVDDSEENIAEWKNCITEAWVNAHRKLTIEGPTNPSPNLQRVAESGDEAMRPKSYPVDYPRTETMLVEDLSRQRSHTDPECGKGNPPNLADYKELVQDKELPAMRQHSNTLAVCCHIPPAKPEQPKGGRRHSAAASLQGETESCSLSDDLTDPAYDSDPEDHIYQTPRSVLKKMSESQDSAVEQEEISDMDSEEEEVYLKMASLVMNQVTDLPPKPPQRSLGTAINSEQQSESDVESINLTVPTKHLQKYLGLQEAGEQLWVSKWKGPAEIGCLFHHGDYIQSMNGFRTGSKELFFQLLCNSVSNEVHLVLTRNKKAPVFHLEGCSCEGL
ncbi:pleckstrin homology domain-containing family S member 1 isoform X2 [Dendropsophus ebraccatus]|uniref:pleckstrin homology domain-containing family S member 1 isoform X2 n=1 Tax=Dendropsophus ebraccatus TaxID=150705 RepID=UPI003831DBD8